MCQIEDPTGQERAKRERDAAMNTYKPRDIYAEAVERMRVIGERDDARAELERTRLAACGLAVIALMLLGLLLYVCSLPAPAPAACPASGDVMQLESTVIGPERLRPPRGEVYEL